MSEGLGELMCRRHFFILLQTAVFKNSFRQKTVWKGCFGIKKSHARCNVNAGFLPLSMKCLLYFISYLLYLFAFIAILRESMLRPHLNNTTYLLILSLSKAKSKSSFTSFAAEKKFLSPMAFPHEIYLFPDLTLPVTMPEPNQHPERLRQTQEQLTTPFSSSLCHLPLLLK